MKHVIVGIDPGTTSAYAVMDFDGNFIAVKSLRNYSFDNLLRDSNLHGNPIVVGGDKKDTPGYIKDYSQKTGAIIHTPGYDTKKEEKKALVVKYGLIKKVKNAHETDALASAIYAYESYRAKIKKIIRYLEKENKMHLMNKMILLVVKEGIGLKAALLRLESKPPVRMEKKKKKISNKDKASAITSLKERNLYLEEENRMLENRLNLLKTKIEKRPEPTIAIKRKTKNQLAFKEKRVLYLENQIKQLRKEEKKLRKLLLKKDRFISDSANMKIVKNLADLTAEEFHKKNKILKIKSGDTLYVEDPSKFSRSVITQILGTIKTIIYSKSRNKAIEDDFLMIRDDEVRLTKEKYFSFVDHVELKHAETSCKKKRTYDKNILSDIVKDYRTNREVVEEDK